MKKLIVAMFCVLFTVGVAFADDLLESIEGDRNAAPDIPQYLLALRYWGIAWESTGDTSYLRWDWIYLYEPYNSLDDVLARLNTYTGQGLKDKDKLVGLWRLGSESNIADTVLNLETTEHVKSVRIEERKWTEYEWKVKGGE